MYMHTYILALEQLQPATTTKNPYFFGSHDKVRFCKRTQENYEPFFLFCMKGFNFFLHFLIINADQGLLHLSAAAKKENV